MEQQVRYMISRERLLDLLESSLKLCALERGGVDNWEWYSDSLVEFLEESKAEGDLAGFIKDMEDEGNIGYGDDFSYRDLADWEAGGYARC